MERKVVPEKIKTWRREESLASESSGLGGRLTVGSDGALVSVAEWGGVMLA